MFLSVLLKFPCHCQFTHCWDSRSVNSCGDSRRRNNYNEKLSEQKEAFPEIALFQ